MTIDSIFAAIAGKQGKLVYVSLKDGRKFSGILNGTNHDGNGGLFLSVNITKQPSMIHFSDIENIEGNE